MSGESKTTRDHDAIRRWAEERNCRPVRIKDTEMIQLDCPSGSGPENFDEIGWDEWFQVFDERGLEFVHQETTSDGQQSSFNKLVDAGS